ncbi:uncharacterized protein ARMOST_00074 [Armillaria ostoyae]|uniref:Fatty acid synthase beta subunit AflB /Fas1-like central domain-containing protein n=1 Tax=Armillaria ostoyae TaxID=47428 RepID=A0A284QK39_ARMOS|nr:uncharacterized protein ARMOST_00074 [Armillaria ostoyae]
MQHLEVAIQGWYKSAVLGNSSHQPATVKASFVIEGFCVAAGIPTTKKAVEIIDGLSPSHRVPSMPSDRSSTLLPIPTPPSSSDPQWTGGRAGGHHSYEDFHQPILMISLLRFLARKCTDNDEDLLPLKSAAPSRPLAHQAPHPPSPAQRPSTSFL